MKLIGSGGEQRERSATCRPDGIEALKVFIKQQLDWLWLKCGAGYESDIVWAKVWVNASVGISSLRLALSFDQQRRSTQLAARAASGQSGYPRLGMSVHIDGFTVSTES
jgi:hypothetical protein